MIIRAAEPAELTAVGALTLAAYVADGFLTDEADYAGQLLDATGRAAEADLVVATDESGTLLGTVTYVVAGTPWAEVSATGEAEFRMLAVAPEGRGCGVGTALSAWCVDRARSQGRTAVVLSTMSQMGSAHRLYERLGFTRAPELDWKPVPHVQLIGYRLDLTAPAPAPS